jgi:hypothetical protein
MDKRLTNENENLKKENRKLIEIIDKLTKIIEAITQPEINIIEKEEVKNNG